MIFKATRTRHYRSSGFTIVEALIALTVLSVGILGLVMSLSSSMTLTDANREEAIALDVARRKLAELQSLTLQNSQFQNIFSNYCSTGPYHSTSATEPQAWSSGASYLANTVTSYGGLTYISLNTNMGHQPDISPANWSLLAQLPPSAVCTVLFPEGAGGTLIESPPLGGFSGLSLLQTNNMGMPQDLDLNGSIDPSTSDKKTSYAVLPVCVNVQWTSVTGPREVNVYTVLAKMTQY